MTADQKLERMGFDGLRTLVREVANRPAGRDYHIHISDLVESLVGAVTFEVKVVVPGFASTEVERTCVKCGEMFLAKRRDAETCSPKCRTALSRQRAKEPSLSDGEEQP